MNLLRFKEIGLLVPKASIGENWQNMHALVSNVVTNGKHAEVKPKILYYMVDNPAMTDYWVTIRSAEELTLCDAPINEKSLPLVSGKEMILRLEISLQRDSTFYNKEIGKESRKRVPQAVVPVYELESWIKQKMSRAGFSVSIVNILGTNKRYVQRKGTEFFIPSALFTLTGNIIDADKFNAAFINGIGRNKGYGYGCLEVISV